MTARITKLLLLFSGLALSLSLAAQYPSNSIKSRLGYQTTGDGLTFRGSGAPAFSPGSLMNAWMYLDTTNFILYHYKNFQWWRLPGANNGLTNNGYYVQLGGSLVQNTQVESAGYTFDLGKISGTSKAYFQTYGSNPYYAGIYSTTGSVEATSTVGNGGWNFEVDGSGHLSQMVGTNTGFYALYLGSLGSTRFTMDSARFKIQGLPDYATHALATAGTASNQLYTITNGRAIYLNSGTGTNVSPNIWDNNTYVGILNSKPFSLGQWTTAGRPSGTTGYEGYNTTGNGKEWYNGTRWAYALESTFARGTATRIPFFDANGQVTDNSGITFAASAGVSVTSTGSDVFTGSSPSASSTAMILQNTSSGTKKWAFAVAGSGNTAPHGSLVFYNYENNVSLLGLYTVTRKVILNQDAGITWATGGTTTLTGEDIGISRATGGVLRMNNGTSLSTASTAAFGLSYGTTAQTPTEFNGQIRMNSDTNTVQIYTGGARSYLATRAYARSLVASATWLKPQLEAGNVTINALSNADFVINNLDTTKFGNVLIRGRSSSLLFINPNVGSSGTLSEGSGFHTNLNGTITGSDGGTGHIVVGGVVTANTSGAIFNVNVGYTNNTSGAYASAFGYNADATADNTLAIGRNSVSDEAGEISIGSSNYTKLNLNASGTAGQIVATNYGAGNKEAADLSKTQSNYNATFATDGTLLEIERKRDTTVYIDDADYDWSAAISTATIALKFNRVIFWMTTTAAAGSDSELTLHTPDANLMQVEYLIHSVDEPAGFDNKIVFGTNNAVDSTNGLVTNYFPAAGDGIHIRAGLRSGVYKYRYSN